jgi:hypothetical protein
MPPDFLTRETSFGDRLVAAQPAALTAQNGRSMAAPKPWRRLHGYVEQYAGLRALVASGVPRAIGLSGPGGIGKTEMLVAALGIEGHAWVDGSVMLAARHAESDDLIALLANAVFGVDPRSRPGTAACSAALAERRLIVGLDDLHSPADLRVLQAALARSLLIFTATHPWEAEDVEWIALRGLGSHGAALLREAAGTHLGNDAAAALVKKLDGNPSRLLRAAEMSLAPKTLLAACRSASAFDELQFDRAREELESADREELVAIATYGEAAIASKAPTAALVKGGFLERSSAGWAVPHGLRERLARLDVNPVALAAVLVVAMDRNPGSLNDSRNLLGCAAGLCQTLESGAEPARDAACDVVRAVDRRGLWHVSTELYTRLRATASALDDAPTWAWATHQLATRYAYAGDVDGARALFTTALDVRKRASGDPAAFLTSSNLAQLAAAEDVHAGAETEPARRAPAPQSPLAPLVAALRGVGARNILAALTTIVVAVAAFGWVLQAQRHDASRGLAPRVAAVPSSAPSPRPKLAAPAPRATPRPAPPSPIARRSATPSRATQRPATQRPATPAAPTQSPATPRPSTPRPSTPRPSTPRPSTPRPSTPRPSTPRPSTPRPAVPGPMPAIASLTVSPARVAAGQSAVVCVEARNATQLHVSDLGDFDPAERSCDEVAPEKTTTYYAWASDARGRWVQRAVTLVVAAPAPSGR